MSKIPTAEEFVMKGHLWVEDEKHRYDLAKSHIEFAKLHVEATLKEAREKTENLMSHSWEEDYGQEILNAYPLTNIK